jgi:Rab-GTPase-TBC domain
MEETATLIDESFVENNSSSTPGTGSMVTVSLSDTELAPQPDLDANPADVSHSRSSSLSSSLRSRSTSSGNGSESPTKDTVDWEELDKSEEQESRGEGTDESTALLLARLEQENAALAGNPKSGLAKSPRGRSNTRPPSVQQLKRMVNGSTRKSLRYSQLPAPAMTELEFWAALVADYPQTAQRLPTLTSNKIRSGVPPPLRGVVWPSISGARDPSLHEEYQRLCQETSPYEGLIGKDVGRSFPNVEMFRDTDGEGQQMLSRVLKCFSLYDSKIGYCQGLGFVVGPLLMHMNDADAFCILVR